MSGAQVFLARAVARSAITCCCWIAITGCDDRPKPPADATAATEKRNAQPTAALPARPPTTQELLTGRRTLTPLGVVPLSIDLPPGWTAQTEGSHVLIDGPAPSGATVSLLPAREPAAPAGRVDLLVAGAKQDATDDARHYVSVEDRSVNGLRVLERVTREDPAAAGGSPSVRVSELVFSPSVGGGDTFDVIELKFLGMNEAQYATDRTFVRSIVDTVRANPIAGRAARTDANAPVRP